MSCEGELSFYLSGSVLTFITDGPSHQPSPGWGGLSPKKSSRGRGRQHSFPPPGRPGGFWLRSAEQTVMWHLMVGNSVSCAGNATSTLLGVTLRSSGQGMDYVCYQLLPRCSVLLLQKFLPSRVHGRPLPSSLFAHLEGRQ